MRAMYTYHGEPQIPAANHASACAPGIAVCAAVSAGHLSDMLGGSRGSCTCAKEVWTTSPMPKTISTTSRVVFGQEGQKDVRSNV
jgi:hypothetical protein